MTFTDFADEMLETKVDLVIPDAPYLPHIDAVAPEMPTAIYANLSNFYLGGLVEDWLEYADDNGHDREDAFYHVASGGAWWGAGGSTQPTTWFHVVLQGSSTFTNRTWESYSTSTTWALPNVVGEHCAIGYFERFREINVVLTAGASSGWIASIEYPTAVDGNKAPTAWATLPLLSDGTSGFTSSGQILFDPPANWKPCKINGSTLNFFARVRCTQTGTAPTVDTFLGRDWSGAAGGTSGTLKAFDETVDANGDGYLTDAEYSGRAAGKDARFRYESRMFTTYGQMRFVVRPTEDSVRAWALANSQGYLDAFPLAKGLFIDNSSGTPGLCDGTPVEDTSSFSQEYADLLAYVAEPIFPKFLIANTTSSLGSASPMVAAGIHYYDEYLLRPLAHTWQGFLTAAETVAYRRQAAAQADVTPSGVLDSRSDWGGRTDPRTLLGVLAEFYVLADTEHQFLEFWGGEEPSGPWEDKWCDAVAFDVGQPTGEYWEWATGADPQDANYVYKVYRREFENAVVLYKPRSFFDWWHPDGTIADATATTHDLGGSFRRLASDGTLGPVVTSISLRNGEGAILAREAE